MSAVQYPKIICRLIRSTTRRLLFLNIRFLSESYTSVAPGKEVEEGSMVKVRNEL